MSQPTRRPWRRAARIALPLAGGALVGLSLPPIGSWPLGIIGAGAVVAALEHRSWRGRLGAGVLAGLGQFSIGLAWAIQFNKAGYVALVIVETLMIAIAAVLVPPRGPLRIPAAAAALTLAEWFRDSWPFGGLPLGSAALGQVGGPLQFTARLGGPLLVVFAMVLAGGAVAELARAAFKRARPVPAATWSLIAVAALAGAGSVAAPASLTHGRNATVSFALVQGGGKRGLTALQVPPSQVFDAAVRETAKVTGHPAVILWPEDVVATGTVPFPRSPQRAVISAIARSRHATMIVGVTEDVGATRFRNEVVAISPTGAIEASFEKVHRVPFGEYVPDRSFFEHFANLSAVPRDAIPGHGSGMISTGQGRYAILVSYEVFFADRGRSGVRAGGSIILVPTNTSSYKNDQAPSQEIAASRLQALEEDRYVLQCAPTGYSAVVNPSGVVLEKTALARPAVIETTVPHLSGTTPYADAGELPTLIACLALLTLAWILGRRQPGEEEEHDADGGERVGLTPPSKRARRRLQTSPSR